MGTSRPETPFWRSEMAKKKEFIVPVFMKIKAEDSNDAMLIADQIVRHGCIETSASGDIPKGFKGFGFDWGHIASEFYK